MSKAKDLTGQRFGKLTAVRPTEERKNGYIVWECVCDCGNTSFVATGNLISRGTKSCGCEKVKDLTGQRFGMLTAVRATDERRHGQVVWECLCDCGRTSFVVTASLTSGSTKSCGCTQVKDLTGQRFGRLTAVRPTEERNKGYIVWECSCDCGGTAFVRTDSLLKGNTRSCGCLLQENMRVDITGKKFGRLTVMRPTKERSENGSVIWECSCDCGGTAFARAQSLHSGAVQSCGCLWKETTQRDLTGQRFGKLTAVRPTEERRSRAVVWECVCDCGNTTFVTAQNLRSGISRSCGCLKTKDLAGQRFGKLTAVRPTGERKSGYVMWECLCDCGGTALVSSKKLKEGRTQSCGCSWEESVRVNIAGQRFGRLTAVRPTQERSGNGAVLWECRCDCGGATLARADSLRKGNTQSCGCLAREKTGETQRIDLTGQKFGKLTAIRPTEERRHRAVVWECACDCGNTTFVTAQNLRGGKTQSCGCLKKE